MNTPLEAFLQRFRQVAPKVRWKVDRYGYLRDEHGCCPIEAATHHKPGELDEALEQLQAPNAITNVIIGCSDGRFQSLWGDTEEMTRSQLRTELERAAGLL